MGSLERIILTYTNEELKILVEEYLKNPVLETVSILAEKLNKPERSIISKLSALGVYKKKVYTTKTGEIPIKKEEYIGRISKLLDIDIELLDSLEKVTKYALVLLDKKISDLKNNVDFKA